MEVVYTADMSDGNHSHTGKLNLYFVRHGETQDNIDRILQGWRDTSLTKKGHEEAKVMASQLQEQQLDAIYHSPLIRMKQTIAPIVSTHTNIVLHSDADLRGQGLGDLEGGSYDSIDLGNPRSADGQPGVELFDDFVRRLRRVFGRVVGVEAPKVKAGSDRNIIVATHGVCITSIFKALEDTRSGQDFNMKVAVRGPEAYEVRWTDSDDVAKLVVSNPASLPIANGQLQWDEILGKPFFIERWGKKEKAL